MTQPIFKSKKNKSLISAAVWRNEKDGKVSHSIAIQRSWKPVGAEDWRTEKITLWATGDGESYALDALIDVAQEVKAFFKAGMSDETDMRDPTESRINEDDDINF